MGLSALFALLAGCAPPRDRATIRLIDGRPQPSRYVSPAAYEHYLRAELLLGRGNRGAAIHHLYAALAFDPDAPYLHTRLAGVLMRTDQIDRARGHLAAALAARPEFPDALLTLAALHQQIGDTATARASLRRCIAHNPRYPAAYLRLAQLLEREGDPRAARRLLETLQARVPDNRSADGALGLLCLRQLDYTCAERAYTGAPHFDGDIETLVRLGHIRRGLGSDEAAVRALREAFDRSGGSLPVAALLLDLLSEVDGKGADDLVKVMAREADDDLERLADVLNLGVQNERFGAVLALLPSPQKTVRLELVRASALARTAGRFAEAEKLLTAELLGDLGAEAALRLAEALEHHKRYADAARVLERAIRRKGSQQQLVLALSRVLYLAGQRDRSVQVVRTALRVQKSQRLRFALGAALERVGRWREAIKVMRKLLEETPDDAALHNFIGYAELEHGGDLGRAEQSIRRAMYLQPGESYIIDSLGWLYFKQGRLHHADRTLSLAVHVAPREAEIIAHLAQVNAALKRLPRAVQLYHRAIRASDDPRLTAHLRDRLRQLGRRQVGHQRQ